MTRKLLTVLLLSLALCGTQVVQASPLHDHAGHFSGCSLCHFDGGQAIKAADANTTPVTESACNRPVMLITHPHNPVLPAYLSRAPPQVSL